MLKFVALAVWGGTACFGIYLLGVWLSHGGLRQQATRITVFPAVLMTLRLAYSWIGFGVLAASAMLGFVMLTRWLVGRCGRHARGAEQHFPGRVVAMHGAAGLTTFALVLITATLATKHG